MVVWNAEERRIVREIETPMTTVSIVRYSPDGRLLAVAGLDPTIRIYDVATGIECRAIDAGGL